MQKPSAAAMDAARAALHQAAEQAQEILVMHIANGVEIRSLNVEIEPTVRIAPGAGDPVRVHPAGQHRDRPRLCRRPQHPDRGQHPGGETTVNASQVYASHLGAGNKIGPFTHVRAGTVTEYGVHLGAYVETKNSNFARGNTVSHLTYIGDSDVGKYCNLGCGTVTCNYDGQTKSRTKIGDYCFIGCNTNLVAPVTVGDGAYTAAGSTITQDVPPAPWASPGHGGSQPGKLGGRISGPLH